MFIVSNTAITMIMATSSLFGWDLTFKTVCKEISAKHDVLIAFVHWNLVKNGFSCLGIGDEKTKKSDDVGSELLPNGWSNGPTYALRYLWHDEVYILHAILSDGNIIFNLLKGSDLCISNLALNIEDTVMAMCGPIAAVIPQYNDIIHRVRVELVEPVTSKITKTMETQTASSVPEPRTIFDPLGRPCGLGVDRGQQGSRSLNERFGNIGSSDLNPLQGGGRGMLFDPFQENYGPNNPGLGIPGGLPRGAVPPGARFDPFSPLAGPGGLHQPPGVPRNPGGRGFPDADHLPPPGYDDMFM